MRKLLWFVLGILFFKSGQCQNQARAADEYIKKYQAAKTPEEKVESAGKVSQLLMTVDLQQADSFGQKAIEHAELSRDRKLMIKAYLYNGQRFSYFAGRKDYITKSLDYFQKAYNIARENKLEKQTAIALMALSGAQRSIPDADKAMNYTNQAFAIISNLADDSLLSQCYIQFGNNYLMKQEKLLALRNYFNATRIAETTKNPSLLRNTYSSLSNFFADIEDYEKALDYAEKAKDKLPAIGGSGEKYTLTNDLYYIGGLYMAKENNDIAKTFYEEGVKLADSLKFEALKIPGYVGLLNLYLSKDPRKALDYFNSNPAIKPFLSRFGFSGVIDQAYGMIYMQLNKLDSSKFYFEKSRPYFENNANSTNKMHFYQQIGKLYMKTGDYKKAIEVFAQINEFGNKMNDLDWQQTAYKNLDSIYLQTGDYKQASLYATKYYQVKDSLDKLGKEKDLQQLQIADEQQRQERFEKERKIAEDRRHNIQYMGITAGIVGVFIVLVMMGLFSVSIRTVKTLGFFAFIFLFEFIILLADNRIHEWTHGEPWKVLLIKIGLIAVLLPLHHYLEHKVIQFITTRKLIQEKGTGWLNRFWRIKRHIPHSGD